MQYHDTSAYSVGNVYGASGAGGGNVSGVSYVNDTSVNSVDATPARVKKQVQLCLLYIMCANVDRAPR